MEPPNKLINLHLNHVSDTSSIVVSAVPSTSNSTMSKPDGVYSGESRNLLHSKDLRRRFARKVSCALMMQIGSTTGVVSYVQYNSNSALSTTLVNDGMITATAAILSVLITFAFSVYKSWCEYFFMVILILTLHGICNAIFFAGVVVLYRFSFLIIFTNAFLFSTCCALVLFTLQSTMELNMLWGLLLTFAATVVSFVVAIVVPFTHDNDAEPIALLSFFVSTCIGIYFIAIIQNTMAKSCSACHDNNIPAIGLSVSPLKSSGQWAIGVIQVYLFILLAWLIVPSLIVKSLCCGKSGINMEW